MSTPLRLAVVGGGQSGEHAVSLASAASVAAALQSSGHDVVRLTIAPDGTWSAAGSPVGLPGAVARLQACDVVVPVLHGRCGEDGTLAALCDLAGVPYVGSGVRAGALAMDKWATKLVAGAFGIATAPGVLVDRRTARAQRFSAPVVVKPVSAGSSLGVSIVRSAATLAPALDAALALDDRALVEDVVVGREIDVAVFGASDGSRVVSPALEVVVSELFDYATKYTGHPDFRVPAPLTETERKALEHAAVTTYDALGCAGVARVDFFLTEDGPVLNEVNTTPGFTEQSQVPRMFAAAGIAYPDLLDRLVRDALVARR